MRPIQLNRSSLSNALLKAGLLVVGFGLSACQSTVSDPARDTAAARQVAALPQVVSEENFQRLGFHEVSEVNQAVIDEPASVFMVRLDHLRAWESGRDANELLTDLDSAFYPVRVHGEIHTSMEMHKNNGVWEAHSIGSAAHARLLDQVRGDTARALGLPVNAFFEVRVLALNTYFLGHQGAKGLVLTPMLDDATLGLKAGESRLASDIFNLLRPLAIAHNGKST